MTVLAAETKGGFFSPPIRQVKKDNVNIIYLKGKKSLKKLKKLDFDRAVIAPCAMEICEGFAKSFTPSEGGPKERLPKILASMKTLPVDELFVSAKPEIAAEIIGICAGCAKLFTVISREEADPGLFDGLYFNRGIVLRRISSPDSRVGRSALCITDGGPCPRGVGCVDLRKLSRVKFYGGELNFLSRLCLEPTAELYAFGGVPLPKGGNISVNYGNEIFYLDRNEIL